MNKTRPEDKCRHQESAATNFLAPNWCLKKEEKKKLVHRRNKHHLVKNE